MVTEGMKVLMCRYEPLLTEGTRKAIKYVKYAYI